MEEGARMLKIKHGFLLRKMMNAHVAVAVGEAGKAFNGMIRLNDAGVFLWKEMQNGIEKAALVQKMLERYENLEPAMAESDLDEFIQTIGFALEGE